MDFGENKTPPEAIFLRNNEIPPVTGGKMLGGLNAKTVKNNENKPEFEPNLRKQ